MHDSTNKVEKRCSHRSDHFCLLSFASSIQWLLPLFFFVCSRFDWLQRIMWSSLLLSFSLLRLFLWSPSSSERTARWQPELELFQSCITRTRLIFFLPIFFVCSPPSWQEEPLDWFSMHTMLSTASLMSKSMRGIGHSTRCWAFSFFFFFRGRNTKTPGGAVRGCPRLGKLYHSFCHLYFIHNILNLIGYYYRWNS